MKCSRSLMGRIAWTIIAIWLIFDAASAIKVSAQARRIRRQRVVMPEQRQEKVNTDISTDFKTNLLEIVQRISDEAEIRPLDLVFVVDGSRRMANAIAEVKKRLPDIANVFDERFIDYQFARTSFSRQAGTPKITTHTFETDLVGIQTWLSELQVSRNAETGYGLDAILQTLKEINCRPEALKHLLLVTGSRLETAWTVENAKDKVVTEIVDLCKLDDIHINIIGVRRKRSNTISGQDGRQILRNLRGQRKEN